ncbi:phage head spike fiber domain-containing protein [Polyangium spumosum]|uniref:Uncharacterized protein n=1 Tax=Polyangium spumosum TaxID=889282 RepID=A0A6N7PRC3_9BACT|nr:hypothetical protein [Polyangium spumosum]MRG94167.1 hypothetical protein [Polyangium spumosum]
MRAWKAKTVFGLGILVAPSLGCQVVGGLRSELSLDEDPGSLPPRDPLVWEATDPGPEMMYTTPEWLEYFNRTEAPRTSQVGPGTLRLGYLKGEARPRNVGMGWGLVMETERTNLNPYSDWGGAGWQTLPMSPMIVEPGAPDPAGGAGGVRLRSEGSQIAPFIVVEGGQVASAWVMGTGGEAPYAYFGYGDSSFVSVDAGAWERYDVKRAASDQGNLYIVTDSIGDAPAIMGPTEFVVFGAQVEVGTYPSSFIPTNGAPVNRDADRLNVDLEDFAPSGYFDVTIRYAPHYASSEQTVVHDLVAVEDDNVFLRMNPGGTLTLLEVGSTDSLVIEGLEWSREQALEVRARYLPNGREISIKGATKGDGSVRKIGPVSPIGEDSRAWLLGDNDGPQESVDLRYLEIR